MGIQASCQLTAPGGEEVLAGATERDWRGGGWLVASYRPKLESSNGINVMVIVRDGVAKAEPQQ